MVTFLKNKKKVKLENSELCRFVFHIYDEYYLFLIVKNYKIYHLNHF